MNKIAIFIENYNIDYNPSFLNFVDYFSDKCLVHIFLKNVPMKNSRILTKNNITVFEIRQNIFYETKILLKEKIKKFIKRTKAPLRRSIKKYSQNSLVKKINISAYANIVCFDPHGFLLCKRMFPQSRPIYYILELYLINDLKTMINIYSQKVLKKITRVMIEERAYINSIKGFIIQSKERERYFRQNYEISPEIPALILPITYKEKSTKQKSLYLRKKFNISEEIKIALHLGGCNFWYSCIEIAKTFMTMDNWILFFQGNHQKKYVKCLKEVIREFQIKNVIVLEEFYDQIHDVEKIIMSSDLGIAWYNDISVNFRTAGKSSGKIPFYFRFGLPVIAKKYPSTVEAIEVPDCGICIENLNELADAIAQIENNYRQFSINAIREYQKEYNFKNYLINLNKFLDMDFDSTGEVL